MVFKQLRAELDKLKEQGQEVVSIDALSQYITHIDSEHGKQQDIRLVEFQAKNQSLLEQYKENRAEWRELFKAVISNGQAAIKMLATINGGAALALLAFIGKVWEPNFSESILGHNITISLLLLCIGLGITALTQGFAYIGQHCFTYHKSSLGTKIQIATIIMGLSSLIIFFVGIIYACKGFGLWP